MEIIQTKREIIHSTIQNSAISKELSTDNLQSDQPELVKTELEKLKFVKFIYSYTSEYDTVSIPDKEHRLIDSFSVNDLIAEITGEKPDWRFTSDDYSFMSTGWQSWDAGWELGTNEKHPKYKAFLMPALKNYIEVPKSIYIKNCVYGQFIIWLRWGNVYLVIASTGKNTPPVQYCLNKKNKTITSEIYAIGKTWKEGDLLAELTCFIADGYFNLKDAIYTLYHDNRFDSLSFLGTKPIGWESWYNHYNKIDETIILNDLESLNTTNNLINLDYIKSKKPVIFQIDDGWQQATGQWDLNTQRFPSGMQNLTEKIKAKGYIPGLWIAPFICDLRCEFIQNHKDWLLKDKNGKPVPAGFNPSWGAACGKYQPSYPHSYFVLDISRDDVTSYIDSLIDRIINDWGFRYIKLDFMFAGTLNGAFSNGGAAYEWYSKILNIITNRKKSNSGDPVAYLGCGMPFESSYKNLPLSRIGTDTVETWDRTDLKMLNFRGRPSAYLNLKDTLGHAFWNGSVYLNDPDVIFLRHSNCTLLENEKETIALVNYLFAGQIMLSDDPASFDEDLDYKLTQHISHLYSLLEDEEFGQICIKTDIYCIFSRNHKYCGIINLSNTDFVISQSNFLEYTECTSKVKGTFANLSCITNNEQVYHSVDGKTYTTKPHSTVIYSVEWK